MSNKITVPITDAVADTLFITLYMRHLETQRKGGIINDPQASRLVESIDYDFDKYTVFKKTQIGTSIRIRHFDREISRFVRENDNPVIVSLGAGLDTRFDRIYAGKGVFYELDLPEVISFRQQLLPQHESNPHMAISMFDTQWISEISNRHPNAQFAILAEGVFMYFEEAQIKPLIKAIAEGFDKGELHFDACSSLGVKNTHRHETVKLTKAKFLWAFDQDDILSTWNSKLHYVDTSYFMNQERLRWGLTGFFFSMIPCVRSMFRMVHYKIIPR